MDKTEKSIDKIDEQIESLLNNKKKSIKSNDKNIINYDNVSTDTKKIEKIGDLEEKDDVIVEETKKIDTVAEVPEEKPTEEAPVVEEAPTEEAPAEMNGENQSAAETPAAEEATEEEKILTNEE